MKTLKLFCFFSLLFMSKWLNAQDFLPFVNNNFAGINAVTLQPAAIADSRFKVDINLIAVSANFNNNWVGIERYSIFNPKSFDTDKFKDNPDLTFKWGGKDKSAIINLQVMGPSFMVTLTPRDAIGFTSRLRSIINIDHVSEDMAMIAYDASDANPLYHRMLKGSNLSIQQSAWAEYGLTYARLLIDKKKHALKAGITIKLVQGLMASYVYGKDINYRIDDHYPFTTPTPHNATAITVENSMFRYGMSDNLNFYGGDNNYRPSYTFIANPTVGFDFGVVYEFRPKYEKYKYDMDGKTNLWRRNKEKYLLKVGISVLDIGRSRYKKSLNSQDFVANVNLWDTKQLEINSIQDINDTLMNRFGAASTDNYFNMNLPTAITAQVDLRIVEGLYINFTPFIALNQKFSDANRVHLLSNYSLTPRYDINWFGIAIPLQINQYNQFNVGLGLRLGPLWIGSNDIFSSLTFNNYRFGADIQFALKIPIPYGKVKDFDHDGVSDKMDKCPKVPGLWKFKGCPDTDNDGIPDSEDECITEPGSVEMHGCPDRDGDGIIDKKDSCPDEKGLPQFFGCPDRDGDGIPDKYDECPDDKGIAKFKGCPDTDNDGIPDKFDECPRDSGLVVFHGCPDTDGDGVPDKDDLCPTIPGPIDNKGCPLTDTDKDGIPDKFDECPTIPGIAAFKGCPDTDGDGIPDKDDECPTIPGLAAFKGCPDTDGDGIPDNIDHCPTVPGVPENYGCPPLKKEDQEVVNTAFDNLEFQTGKAIIKASSFAGLDKLAGLLKKKADWRLLLSGHTDNVGGDEKNMTLSKTRANAVKSYLIKQGVPESKIKTEWFGSKKPIADNTTEEGRQKNRRVEMTIMFDDK